MTAFDDGRIALVGAGRMGGALLRGWLALGVPGERLTVIEPQADAALSRVCDRHAVSLNPADRDLAASDILVLAVKPQVVEEAAASLAPHMRDGTLLLSIVAGKTVADLAKRLPGARPIVRAMPNTPAAIGRGVTGVFADREIEPVRRGAVERLLGAVGRVEWLDREGDIDAVTAVSGSGPAYVFYLTECLAKAGERAGLAPDLALRLARATVEGAGELMFREPETEPATLRRNVTSPGGTTAAALDVLSAPSGLEDLLGRAVAAAKRRAEDLAG